jgi:hypothetical protein
MRTLVFIALFTALATHASAKSRKDPVQPPPLVRTNIAPPPPIITPIAPSATWGSWRTTDFGDYTIARTENESGSVFGVLCGKTCVYFVNFKKDCNAGDPYPAMVNGPSGSFAITLKCYHLGDNRRVLTFDMDDNAIGMLEHGGEVGFAIPLDGGKFGVSRFSLVGGLDAVTAAVEAITAKRQARQEGLRDFTI